MNIILEFNQLFCIMLHKMAHPIKNQRNISTLGGQRQKTGDIGGVQIWIILKDRYLVIVMGFSDEVCKILQIQFTNLFGF